MYNSGSQKKKAFSNSSNCSSLKKKKIRSHTMTTNITNKSESQNLQNLKDQIHNNLIQLQQNEITNRTNPSTILTNNYGGNIISQQNTAALLQQNISSKSPLFQQNENSPQIRQDWNSVSREALSPLKKEKLLQLQNLKQNEGLYANSKASLKAQQIQLQQELLKPSFLKINQQSSQIPENNAQQQQNFSNQISEQIQGQSPLQINTFNQNQNIDQQKFSQQLQQKELQKLIQQQQEIKFKENIQKENNKSQNSSEYYRQKSYTLKNKVKKLEKENDKLQNEINKMRELNFDYVKMLNDIGTKRTGKNKQIVQISFLDQYGPIPDKVKENIYQLRCRIDHIEDASRSIQQGIQQAYQEKDEYAIKVGDLETQNKFMKKSINNFVQTTERLNDHIKKGVVMVPSSHGLKFNFK
ncbi:hypothetical protein PPERSA_02164 [Pseudocohnilembus persalinus]|uniref:Uncharacterized protein n=1 Tax=Pseudocohnilembus persalinus TaxID=266149 RepID=A0A0V0Q7Q6_PSEPJ|nr:hypothetical protein PPERSA_02164 [Pseudocohnilembus persalinus]|eukprot:KRW98186.1 hypothetical protein PPERSA_02164 [Pseudocohnilembus persalinus]